MTPAAIIREAAADGVCLELSPAGTIKATGDQAAANRWLPVIRERKPAIVAYFKECTDDIPDTRPDLPGVSGEFIPRVHIPPDAEIKAGLREALARIQAEERNAAVADLARVHAIQEAPPPCISREFADRLSPEDRTDLAAGDIPPETVQVFEQAAVAREAEDLGEFFEERAGILEHDAGLPRPDAEIEAARITATLARNRGCLWASLREALAHSPSLLSQVPDRAGPIDSLPVGTATVHVGRDKRVVRQGTFTGAPEVKP